MKQSQKLFLILGLVVLGGLSFWLWQSSRVEPELPVNQPESAMEAPMEAPVGLANPASVNCEKVGGRLSIETQEDGSQYGLCYFDGNRVCEEWALFRGECPVGGIENQR